MGLPFCNTKVSRGVVVRIVKGKLRAEALLNPAAHAVIGPEILAAPLKHKHIASVMMTHVMGNCGKY